MQAALLERAEHLLARGDFCEARHAALAAQQAAEHAAAPDPRLFDAIGNVLSRARDQPSALAAYDRAVALAPEQPDFRFNRATIRRFLGDLAGAEADYDRVIALKANDYEAYLNRSELRPQTATHNHTQALEAVLAGGIADARGEIALEYALAKEYEDLGQFERSFAHLARGARLRRAHLQYDVDRDVSTVDWIIEAYPASHPEEPSVTTDAGPLFIVGLPRSGSTLIERILSRHSKVQAGGELPQFALALVAAVKRLGHTAPLSRQALVRLSARVHFGALGQDYLARVRAAGIEPNGACFTDKMPLNYLYCGLIGRALPAARIIHVRRHPMAACYAIFKTLFRDGYPFSYDLNELAKYYIAYDRLMRHWAQSRPGSLHEVRYEALVANPEHESRRLLEFCGLEWEDACVDFHANAEPTTTASAAQVRRPLYDTSVSLWRNYRAVLAPIERQLQAAGIHEA